ncbi:hypothetical protein [Microbacterium sp. SORGH_AS_0862]|uniref:hypothetical protein n=1 Tax=Microbacterium sp. SORGH_AS_0862 TaxID=3041789 RepID=UPI0027943600|nr:hypothetical protein [Microbacterium sp. SORGH_AS_0862]MDQ1206599.1 hypothetical protein [Microbacterium sp. SORGH_AS_0862]
MGTNKRYADAIDRRVGERILERAAADGPLQHLTDAELELDRRPLTIDPQPKPAKAWVRFGSTPVLVDALVNRWTSRACGISFEVAGKQMRTWVWASAVSEAPRGGDRNL